MYGRHKGVGPAVNGNVVWQNGGATEIHGDDRKVVVSRGDVIEVAKTRRGAGEATDTRGNDGSGDGEVKCHEGLEVNNGGNKV